MKKKKIYFLAPKNKGGTFFYYKKISEYLIKNNSDIFDVHFIYSLLGYIKLHFTRADYIFSIIPFVFKPLRSKKYIYNLHGNFKIERKNKGLGVKLLYLSELNLWFSDNIMLTSYYLADKLNFKERYKHKIEIVPNFVDEVKKKNEQLRKNDLNFLTVTSFKFYEKAKGIINLGNVIQGIAKKIPEKNINFTIIGNENNDIFLKVKNKFDEINLGGNVNVIWKGWLEKEEIEKEFLINNIFLYWTELDNYPGVILDALNYNLKIYVNNYESFKYFLDEDMLFDSEGDMIKCYFNNRTLTYNNGKYYLLKNIMIKIKKILG